MPKYYVASSSNNAEGPYSFEELEALYKEGKILSETLVCPEGGQEWFSFGSVYKHYREEMLLEKKQELNKQLETQKSDAELFLELFRTVEGIFRFVGIIALIAGFILFCNNVEEKQTEIGFIYLVSGAFSCLGCFWCAKVLTLLQKIADKK